MKKVFPKILNKVSGKKILVIGDLILDEYIWGDATRISPEAPVPVIRVSSRTHSPGGAANVANNLRALGIEVLLCGITGDDGYGRLFSDLLKGSGVNISGIISDSGRPTTLKTRIMAQGYQIARADQESITPINSSLIKKIASFISKHLKVVDAIIISDYGKGVINEEFLDIIRPKLLNSGKIINIDPKVGNFPLYIKATTITPNKKEAEGASGITIKGHKSLLDAGDVLMKKLSLSNLLITRGEEGMSLFCQDRVFHIPTVARAVYDVTGAGDTVISHYTAFLCAGASPIEAAALSNISAGIKVTKLGSATVSIEELKSYLKEGHDIGNINEEVL